MSFASPAYFYLLLLLVPYILWHFLGKKKQEAHMTIASAEAFRHSPRTWRTRLVQLPFWLHAICFTLLVIILARPQTQTSLRSGESEGIDIMMAMDISTSMMTNDIRPSRMTAAKEVALNFISNRPSDNIGLTLFGGDQKGRPVNLEIFLCYGKINKRGFSTLQKSCYEVNRNFYFVFFVHFVPPLSLTYSRNLSALAFAAEIPNVPFALSLNQEKKLPHRILFLMRQLRYSSQVACEP